MSRRVPRAGDEAEAPPQPQLPLHPRLPPLLPLRRPRMALALHTHRAAAR